MDLNFGKRMRWFTFFVFVFGLFVLVNLDFVDAQSYSVSPSSGNVRPWEQVEVTFTASNSYSNAYKDVDFWVQLQGPGGFNKQVYGFWDGGNTWRVRMLGNQVGTWTWTSGSNTGDSGLNSHSGSFTVANPWSESEKSQNPNRRGIIGPSSTGRGLMYADGTPAFLIADTWWSSSTQYFEFKGVEPASNYQPSSGIGFEEALQYLKNKGYNSVAIIASFPNWVGDGLSSQLTDSNGVPIRQAWGQSGSAMNMVDEDNERPFQTPGPCSGSTTVRNACANFDLINPGYWQNLDVKYDYMWENGFAPYMEALRRDHGPSIEHFYDEHDSYARYLNYISARYGTYNFIFSLLHMDTPGGFNIDTSKWDSMMNHYYNTYGDEPFGVMTAAQGAESTLQYFGDDAYMDLHGVGNGQRHHGIYSKLVTIFQNTNKPAWNNEPYYTGWNVGFNNPGGENAPTNSDRDNYFARAQMYGNVLSGGLAGHVYGTGDFHGQTIYQHLQYDSIDQMKYLKDFMLSEGNKYWELEYKRADLNPSTSPGATNSNLDGWSHLMVTGDKTLAMAYFENLAQQATISNLLPNEVYQAQWFNPRTGQWSNVGSGTLTATGNGQIALPQFPGGVSTLSNNQDWALKLVASNCNSGQTESCGTNEGVCTIGTRTCNSNGFWGACSGVTPSAEMCDGLDNDCNGQADDGVFCIGSINIPGRVEAEDYNNAQDSDSQNEGGDYRNDFGVDIETVGGVTNVGWIANGEWLEYEIDVVTAGQYDLTFRVASLSNGGSFNVLVNGNSFGSVNFGATGDWHNWVTQSLQGVALSSGTHTLRIQFTSDAFNLDYIDFVEAGSNPGPVCGQNGCENGESCSSCPQDCGQCTGGSCSTNPADYVGMSMRDLADLADFDFGNAVDGGQFGVYGGGGSQAYRDIMSDEFNMLVAENDMKMNALQPSQGSFSFGNGDQMVSFAQQHGQIFHGHALVWHEQMPGWLSGANYNRQQALDVMENHIETVMLHYPELEYWDVFNEALNGDGSLRNSVWKQWIGDDYVIRAFDFAAQVRANNPQLSHIKLIYNDYNVEGINSKSDGMFTLVNDIIAAGIPIDGVGMQSHFDTFGDEVPGSFGANIARFGAITNPHTGKKLEVRISELDVAIPRNGDFSSAQDYQEQAVEYAETVRVCLEQPACTGVMVWDFYDGSNWKNSHGGTNNGNAGTHDRNYQPKPAWFAMKDEIVDHLVNNVCTGTQPPQQSSCAFLDLSWSTTSATQGDVVQLNVLGDGCTNQDSLSFQVYERSPTGLFDRIAEVQPVGVNFNNNAATTTWTVEYNPDLIIDVDPEYYFVATINSNSVSAHSPYGSQFLLHVDQGVGTLSSNVVTSPSVVVEQDGTFTYEIEVVCEDGDCGDVEIALDPFEVGGNV